jgi:hypothetical protein
MLEARKRVGELLDVKAETLPGWIKRQEIDAAGGRACQPRSTRSS